MVLVGGSGGWIWRVDLVGGRGVKWVTKGGGGGWEAGLLYILARNTYICLTVDLR